jgi:hypothetical protein
MSNTEFYFHFFTNFLFLVFNHLSTTCSGIFNHDAFTGAIPTTNNPQHPTAGVRVPAAADSYGMVARNTSTQKGLPGTASAIAGVKPILPAGATSVKPIDGDLWSGLSKDSRVVMVGDYQLLGEDGVSGCCLNGLQVSWQVSLCQCNEQQLHKIQQ